MIEFRSYQGDAAEIAAFTQRVWIPQFRGEVTIPVWDADYFAWQLLENPTGDRTYLVAAYDDDRLVGSLFGEPFRFRLGNKTFDALMSSWLTVDPASQGKGIARGLVTEFRRRMQEGGQAFLLGFGLRGSTSKGPGFWGSYKGETVFPTNTYWWGHPVDLQAIAQNESALHDRLGARLLSFFPHSENSGKLPQRDPDIRPYREEDLARCLALMTRSAESVDLSYVWNERRLAHQLSFRGIPTTLVMEKDGRVAGLVNSYRMGLYGRGPYRAGVIDFFVTGDLSFADQSRLMSAAIADLTASGAQAVLTTRMSGVGRALLVRKGFVPVIPPMRTIVFRIDPSIPVEQIKSLQVHVR